MTESVQGNLNIKDTTTVESVLHKLDTTKSVARNCDVDDTQITHKNDNKLETIFYQEISFIYKNLWK